MSTHVTVTENPVNVRRRRMVLSDLDQIKKNERDRRRRLRLEQVRQQSKEISNRLLERAKKIAREELSKLEKDGKSELRQMYDRKIMDMQRQFQEDLEDIGQAHASAILQPDANAIMEEERRKDRTMALKRGKDAIERMKEAKQTEDAETAHHEERLRRVREMENIRATMIAKLPKPLLSEENDRMERNFSQSANKEIMPEILTPKKKNKKVVKKSPKSIKKSNLKEYKKIPPKLGPSGLQKKSAIQSHELSSRKKVDKYESDHIEHVIDDASDDQIPRKTVPTMSTIPTKSDKIARYNPEDYTHQNTSSSVSSSNSSGDSSYFSDAIEQIVYNKIPRTPGSTENKVQSQYSRNMHQKYIYKKPLGTVERIDIRNEPSAIEVAQAMKNAENVEMHISKNRKLNAQRRGEDAILREKVRRDYQALLQNLDHLAQEERKLKASQIQSAEEDTYMRLHQRNKCQEEHQKKMNRVAKKVLSDGASSRRTHLTERVITLPMQKKDVHDDVPHSTWQDPYFIEEQIEDDYYTPQDKDSEMSREEQILDMLKKVERQKRLLLQEFGASLPDNIFNVSMKPFFEDKMPIKTSEAGTTKPSSPEIKVINMSSSDEYIKKDHIVKRPDKLPAKKIEIAVQTALEPSMCPAKNKSVQVELSQEDVHMPQSSKEITTRPPHPIEPKITIITPETDDSSNNSTSSEISEMIIEIDKKEVIVTPKKKKGSIRVSKRPSPRIYQKIRSTPVSSKATSPMKRFSRSQSGSRLTPQKKTKCLDTPDTATRRVDIHMSESTQVDDETDPSQETRVSIDASAESSQTCSGLNDQDQSSGKPYRVRTQTKRWIRMKDSSDTSTSFASPPPIKPKSIFDALTNVTPILEMLDSPAPELRRLRDISPVSTPETPSPRTMMMPSNIPHRDRISRMLRFSLNDSQTNDSIVISSMQKDQSTLTEPSDICQKSEASKRISISEQPSSKVCICKNPQCKLLHIKLDDIHDYALKNCPEILQKYEDLQNLCTERIASLNDLIERVRNEQKDMDFSLISPSDDTSLMQLSTSQPSHNEQAVRRLIDNIETIHAQLARTLVESQKIIRGSEATSKDETLCDVEIQATTSTPRSKLVDTVKTYVQESKIVKGRAKPKIISNEKVNIPLNRFKMQQKPQAMSATKISERHPFPPCTVSLHEEEVIEKLSKEILEQSKNLDKASTAFAALKENEETQHKVSSFMELDLKKSTSLEHEKDNITHTKELASTSEVAKENDFIPILTGIPKILRNYGNATSISARPKPPVTLLNGLYRPELESSGHELSTIVEFDTTDTVTKSSKSPTKSKPSVHVAPLPVQNQDFSKKEADSSSDMKLSVEKLSSAQQSRETTTICKSPEKLKNLADCITETKIEAERECMLEKCNKQLQCNTITEESISQAKDKLSSSISTDLNNLHKESKHRTISTSLYSFSGLSGISEITSSPSLSSDVLKHNSSPEEMETALKKLGLGWAVTTLKKTREASALSSSSNSDVTPINTARRISPTKKQHDSNVFPDISDVSSISIKEASKSTDQAVLLKGRTSTPKFQNSNSNSERSSTTNTSESVQDPSDSLTVPNLSLTKAKSDNKQLQSP